MFRMCKSLAMGGAALALALLLVSSAAAQPSSMGHAVASGYRPPYSAGSSTLRVYPGDKGYHSTMQIQRYHQVLERVAPAVSATRMSPHPAAASTASSSAGVAVSYPESAAQPMMVDIRGPDGKVRSFSLAKGRDTIRYRTIIVRPGESLTLHIQGATVQAPQKKPR